jgi:D-alanyl-D-alanine carboxypeptidase
MTVLGRHLMYDFPGYYPMFKRKTTIATKKVRNTNRKFLAAYKGADGIKTGYTRKAGFNLVASAERNGKRVIATVFGGKSTRTRNIQVAKLLDLGFERTLENVELIPPMRIFQETPKDQPNNIIVVKSLRPKIRTDSESNNILLAMALDIAKTVKIKIPERVTKIIDIVDINSSEKLNNSGDLIVVSRDSSPQIKNWKVNLGLHNTRFQAEKSLLKAALHELSLLEGAKRKVINKTRGFESTFSNLTKSKALKVCVKLLARNFKNCQAQGPT